MLVGYEWIFDVDSDAIRKNQRQALINAGVAISDIYSDADDDENHRPGLEACLSALKSGDTLVVWQLERLVNSRAELLSLLRDLSNRNIGLKVLTGHGAILDTTHLDLNLAVDIIAAVNDLETKILRKRTKTAHAAARQRGQKLGPQRKMTPAMLRQAIAAMTQSERSMTGIAADLGITRVTLYAYLNGDGSLKPAGQTLLAEDESQESDDSSACEDS